MTKLSFPRRVDLRIVAIGLISFLTLVDLFAAQALLPALVRHFRVTPGAMGIAVNASTFGMAVAGIAVALFARRIDKASGSACCCLPCRRHSWPARPTLRASPRCASRRGCACPPPSR
jgi:MFS family permease